MENISDETLTKIFEKIYRWDNDKKEMMKYVNLKFYSNSVRDYYKGGEHYLMNRLENGIIELFKKYSVEMEIDSLELADIIVLAIMINAVKE